MVSLRDQYDFEYGQDKEIEGVLYFDKDGNITDALHWERVKNWGSKREVLNPILHLLGSKKCVFMLKYAEEGF